MFEDILTDHNPHWIGELRENILPRSVLPLVLDWMKTPMIVSLVGVRGCGKSTLLYAVINHLILKEHVPPENILYLNLEETRFTAYRNDPLYLETLLEDYRKLKNPSGLIYCFFDEIQYFEQWPIFVKSHFERKKMKFFLTGSNSTLLSSDLLTLLSGRTLSLEIYPLAYKEFIHQQGISSEDPTYLSVYRTQLKSHLENYLECGGFPAPLLEAKSHQRSHILNAYAKSILYQDVIPRLKLRKPIELEELFTYMVSNIGKSFSYARLARHFSLSDKQVKEYLIALEESFLLFEVDLFSYSVSKQIRNPKKIYAIDTGMVTALGIHFSKNVGRLLENGVFLELKRLNLRITYYKTRSDREVDFSVQKGTQLALVQVAWQTFDPETKEREITALVEALKELKLTSGLLLTSEEDWEKTFDGIRVVALSAYKFFCLKESEQIQLLFSQD